MTQALHQKRLAAVRLADAVNAIDGVPVSGNAKDLSARWARGEISGEQMKSMLGESHKRMAQPESGGRHE